MSNAPLLNQVDTVKCGGWYVASVLEVGINVQSAAPKGDVAFHHV